MVSIVPKLRNGWAILGELDKWVGVSLARVVHFTTHSDNNDNNNASVQVTVRGSEGEIIHWGFISPVGDIVQVTCEISSSATVEISSFGFCN